MPPNSPTKYDQYVAETVDEIAKCLQATACQPILFVGSGFSKRYFAGPNWDELLFYLAKSCPLIQKEYAYYKQLYANPQRTGEEFARLFHEWAWGEGKAQFPVELFNESISVNAYIKHFAAEYLESLTPKNTDGISPSLIKELAAVKNIHPHALITTNYDRFLEVIFPEYQPIIGQQIIQAGNLSIGEIFKIHGCVSSPVSMVLTESDYTEFTKRKKYLSAKLLTFFSEHPLLFIGYSAGDPNIRAILSDIDEALPTAGGVIPNVFILEWHQDLPTDEFPAREKLIAIEDAKSVRIKSIVADDFAWVFEAFGKEQALNGVSPKVLRALLHRSFELVRHDIPRKIVQADFQMLEHAVENQNEFAKLFGITTINEPSALAANYPYTLTQVGKKLKSNYWAKAQQAIDSIKMKHGFDVKASDNKYHCATKYGKTSIHKYSEDAVVLFRKVLSGQAYELELPNVAKAKKASDPV
jgi:hypothetical protein